MKLLLTTILVLSYLPLAAQMPAPPRPAIGHTSDNALLVAAYGTAGRVPGFYRYAAAGLGLARRNRWRYSDAEYDSDFTFGLRLGAGKQQAYTGSASPGRALWGVNPYAAVDGRFFGAVLGMWMGQLGNYRAEGLKQGRVVPQVRVRAGQLNGLHGLLAYANEFGGLGNPPLQVGGAYGGVLGGRVHVGIGAAIATLALPEQEIGVYAETTVRGSFGEGSLYLQLPVGADAPGLIGVRMVVGGSN